MPTPVERIVICPNESGQPVWMGSPPLWWETNGLARLYSARLIDTQHPIYMDYGGLVTPGEALAWDEQCRAAFAQDLRSQDPAIAEQMDGWRDALARARWIIVESNEWESGLS